MSSFFKRITAIVGKLFATAEDPRQTMLFGRQRLLLEKVEQVQIDLAVSMKQLEQQERPLLKKVDLCEAKAVAALRQEKPEAARQWLQRQYWTQKKLAAVQDRQKQMQAEYRRLVGVEQALAAQAERFLAKQALLQQQYDAAQAQAYLQKAVRGAAAEWAAMGDSLEAIEVETDWMQATSELFADELDLERPIVDQLEEMELQTAVDRKLAQLQSEAGN